jgi:hypothetical protein
MKLPDDDPGNETAFNKGLLAAQKEERRQAAEEKEHEAPAPREPVEHAELPLNRAQKTIAILAAVEGAALALGMPEVAALAMSTSVGLALAADGPDYDKMPTFTWYDLGMGGKLWYIWPDGAFSLPCAVR